MIRCIGPVLMPKKLVPRLSMRSGSHHIEAEPERLRR